jgi:hypothetical protein
MNHLRLFVGGFVFLDRNADIILFLIIMKIIRST